MRRARARERRPGRGATRPRRAARLLPHPPSSTSRETPGAARHCGSRANPRSSRLPRRSASAPPRPSIEPSAACGGAHPMCRPAPPETQFYAQVAWGPRPAVSSWPTAVVRSPDSVARGQAAPRPGPLPCAQRSSTGGRPDRPGARRSYVYHRQSLAPVRPPTLALARHRHRAHRRHPSARWPRPLRLGRADPAAPLLAHQPRAALSLRAVRGARRRLVPRVSEDRRPVPADRHPDVGDRPRPLPGDPVHRPRPPRTPPPTGARDARLPVRPRARGVVPTRAHSLWELGRHRLHAARRPAVAAAVVGHRARRRGVPRRLGGEPRRGVAGGRRHLAHAASDRSRLAGDAADGARRGFAAAVTDGRRGARDDPGRCHRHRRHHRWAAPSRARPSAPPGTAASPSARGARRPRARSSGCGRRSRRW